MFSCVYWAWANVTFIANNYSLASHFLVIINVLRDIIMLNMVFVLLALLVALSPRFILFFMWLFDSSRLDAFGSFWWPFLGFLFLPFTTLMYVLVWSASNGVSFIGWLLVGFAFMIDLGSYGIGARRRRSYQNMSSGPVEVENLNEK